MVCHNFLLVYVLLEQTVNYLADSGRPSKQYLNLHIWIAVWFYSTYRILLLNRLMLLLWFDSEGINLFSIPAMCLLWFSNCRILSLVLMFSYCYLKDEIIEIYFTYFWIVWYVLYWFYFILVAPMETLLLLFNFRPWCMDQERALCSTGWGQE